MDDLEEVWVEVDDFPKYLVSNQGRVRHIDRIQPRKLSTNRKGFPTVVLFRENDPSRYLRQVNRLVASTFLSSSPDREENHVWHIDGNLENCYISNLRWDTRPRVLEWNRMNRSCAPTYTTPRVRNNVTGRVYENAYECGMVEGKLESLIVWLIDGNRDIFDDKAKYCYVKDW